MNALHAISRTIGEMSEIATGIAGAMEQQSATTREIANNSGPSSGAREVTAAIAGLAEASGAVDASAGEVLGGANGLSRSSDRLREQMQQFLARVCAA